VGERVGGRGKIAFYDSIIFEMDRNRPIRNR